MRMLSAIKKTSIITLMIRGTFILPETMEKTLRANTKKTVPIAIALVAAKDSPKLTDAISNKKPATAHKAESPVNVNNFCNAEAFVRFKHTNVPAMNRNPAIPTPYMNQYIAVPYKKISKNVTFKLYKKKTHPKTERPSENQIFFRKILRFLYGYWFHS